MQNLTFYKWRIVFLSLVWVSFLCRCDSLPEKPSYLDYDPNNPEYKKPEVTIVFPQNDEVIASDSVTLIWEGNTSGMTYSYKLDSNPYSTFTTQKSANFRDLPDGMHYFSVYGKYPTGFTSTSDFCRFLIWNYNGPGLIFYPAEISQPATWAFYIQLLVIDTTPINSVYCKIHYNSTELEATTIDFYGDDKGFLLKNGGYLVNSADIDSTQGQVLLQTQVFDGTPPDVAGSGRIAELRFRHLQGDTVQVEISPDSYFMTSGGAQIPLTLIQGTTLIATTKEGIP